MALKMSQIDKFKDKSTNLQVVRAISINRKKWEKFG